MDEKIFKKKEEIKTDADVNLPSSEEENPAVVENVEVELNSTPVPTKEEEIAADITPNNSDIDSHDDLNSENIEIKEELTPEQKSVEKMLTQSQVDEIVGRTRTETRDKTKAETLNGFYSRYGVKDEAELDDMVGKAQKSDLLREDYDKLVADLQEAKNKIAMFESGIDPERYEDARLILTGKGMEITAENITKEMATHPEWKKTLPTPASANDEIAETFRKAPEIKPEPPVSKISVLGNEAIKKDDEVSERDMTMDWYRS